MTNNYHTNKSGIIVKATPSTLVSQREYCFYYKGKKIAEIDLFIDGALFINHAKSVHVKNENVIKTDSGKDGYTTINFKPLSGLNEKGRVRSPCDI